MGGTVYVCPTRDIECGQRADMWCQRCPLNLDQQEGFKQRAALEYYQAAVEQRAPKYVPASVRLKHDVRSDFPFAPTFLARAGVHDCVCNRWGAVSVLAEDGQQLGIKPAEFEPVTWRLNEQAERRGAA